MLKQRDYAKLKGISFSENGYDTNYNIAEQLGYIIGRDCLLQKHFYNDIDGIREELKKYEIDHDQMLQMSSQFCNGDSMSIDFWKQLINPDNKEEIKAKYQYIMVRGFVLKRCEELGITDINKYYKGLKRGEKKTELAELEKFEQFKICDSPMLEQIRESLQPKSLL